MTNKNSTKLENCNSCYSCYSCNSCYSCDFCDFCDFSKGLRMSEKMIFCVGEGKYKSKGKGYQKNHQIFNIEVSEEEYKKVKDALNVKNFRLPLTSWCKVEDIESPTTTQKQMGGYLKQQSYTDAWAEMWEGMSQEDKDFITSITHFNKDIFKEITGIDVEEKTEELTMEEVCKELGRTVKIKK